MSPSSTLTTTSHELLFNLLPVLRIKQSLVNFLKKFFICVYSYPTTPPRAGCVTRSTLKYLPQVRGKALMSMCVYKTKNDSHGLLTGMQLEFILSSKIPIFFLSLMPTGWHAIKINAKAKRLHNSHIIWVTSAVRIPFVYQHTHCLYFWE